MYTSCSYRYSCCLSSVLEISTSLGISPGSFSSCGGCSRHQQPRRILEPRRDANFPNPGMSCFTVFADGSRNGSSFRCRSLSSRGKDSGYANATKWTINNHQTQHNSLYIKHGMIQFHLHKIYWWYRQVLVSGALIYIVFAPSPRETKFGEWRNGWSSTCAGFVRIKYSNYLHLFKLIRTPFPYIFARFINDHKPGTKSNWTTTINLWNHIPLFTKRPRKEQLGCIMELCLEHNKITKIKTHVVCDDLYENHECVW